jgi:hypothetical protein
MHDENYGQALKAVAVSDITVVRQTESVSEYIKEHLLTQIKCSPKSAFQIDKSINAVGLPQLLVFVRCYSEENIHEDFTFFRSLAENSEGSEVFKAVDSYNTSNFYS